MKPAGRITAAIEVLDDVLTRHRPAAAALGDWGKAHRVAGSGDRSAIGTLVYDALRRRSSIAWRMNADTPRALAIAAAGQALGLPAEEVAALCDGSQHAPAQLDTSERQGLDRDPAGAPPHIQGDIPEWLWPKFEAVFGASALHEGQALAARAPVDLRANTLKATRDKVLKALEPFGATETPLSPVGLRLPSPAAGKRSPNVEAEAGFQKGWYEIQDEGSQLAALIAAAAHPAGGQVLDLCAGGGGKTLALAAAKAKKGQIFAFDTDRHRLAPIHDRLKRAGAHNVQVRGPRDGLDDLLGRMDLVLVDAPCSGTGVWRRKPESKWKLSPEQLGRRIIEQRALLDQAVRFLKPGGRLAYVTCSLLSEENEAQIDRVLADHGNLKIVPARDHWTTAAGGKEVPGLADKFLRLSPFSSQTDGFFVALLERRG